MSREIKFRVWDNWQKKYVFTGFHVIGEVTVFGGIDSVIDETREPRFAARGYETSCEAWNDFELEEWTGLIDQHGKDIYENDILEHVVPNYTYGAGQKTHGIVRGAAWTYIIEPIDYKGLLFCIGDLYTYGGINPSQSVVVGNIRENPEFLST